MTRSTYTSELAAAICARAAKGQNLRAISEQPGMPNRVTLHRWLNRHAEFRRRYDEACARRAFVLIRPKTDPAAPRRRSPIYTPELGQLICDHLLDGLSLNQVSHLPGMPHLSNINMWLNRHEDFRRSYVWACHFRNEAIADRILAIADSCTSEPDDVAPYEQLARIKLQIAALKQRYAVLTPKKDWLA